MLGLARKIAVTEPACSLSGGAVHININHVVRISAYCRAVNILKHGLFKLGNSDLRNITLELLYSKTVKSDRARLERNYSVAQNVGLSAHPIKRGTLPYLDLTNVVRIYARELKCLVGYVFGERDNYVCIGSRLRRKLQESRFDSFKIKDRIFTVTKLQGELCVIFFGVLSLSLNPRIRMVFYLVVIESLPEIVQLERILFLSGRNALIKRKVSCRKRLGTHNVLVIGIRSNSIQNSKRVGQNLYFGTIGLVTI